MTKVIIVVTSQDRDIGKIHEGVFWDMENILDFDLDSSYMGVNIKQAVCLRLVYFIIDMS